MASYWTDKDHHNDVNVLKIEQHFGDYHLGPIPWNNVPGPFVLGHVKVIVKVFKGPFVPVEYSLLSLGHSGVTICHRDLTATL